MQIQSSFEQDKCSIDTVTLNMETGYLVLYTAWPPRVPKAWPTFVKHQRRGMHEIIIKSKHGF
jgi:hypothetical protein